MELNKTTTTFEIPGFTITRNLGMVRGIIVRSRSIFGTIGAGLQTIVGGNITLLTELCEKTRLDAYTEMMLHAEILGANAVVGIRYQSAEVMSNVTEVICYGTAVVVELKEKRLVFPELFILLCPTVSIVGKKKNTIGT